MSHHKNINLKKKIPSAEFTEELQKAAASGPMGPCSTHAAASEGTRTCLSGLPPPDPAEAFVSRNPPGKEWAVVRGHFCVILFLKAWSAGHLHRNHLGQDWGEAYLK